MLDKLLCKIGTHTWYGVQNHLECKHCNTKATRLEVMG